jgi:hypothetical protein
MSFLKRIGAGLRAGAGLSKTLTLGGREVTVVKKIAEGRLRHFDSFH